MDVVKLLTSFVELEDWYNIGLQSDVWLHRHREAFSSVWGSLRLAPITLPEKTTHFYNQKHIFI